MQYLLTQEEYVALKKEGNLESHKQFMTVIGLLYNIHQIEDYKYRLDVYDDFANDMSMFHQSGDESIIKHWESRLDH